MERATSAHSVRQETGSRRMKVEPLFFSGEMSIRRGPLTLQSRQLFAPMLGQSGLHRPHFYSKSPSQPDGYDLPARVSASEHQTGVSVARLLVMRVLPLNFELIGGTMRPDELTKSDRVSELVLLGSGVAIFLPVLLLLLAVITGGATH